MRTLKMDKWYKAKLWWPYALSGASAAEVTGGVHAE